MFNVTGYRLRSALDEIYWAMRRVVIRTGSWEYWPFHLIYAPMYFYWVWLSIRGRCFFFFSAANPGIENSGFVQERKSDIYKQIPSGYYPKTLLCPQNILYEDLSNLLVTSQLDFPLMAKPDIGERGLGVRLLKTRSELFSYWNSNKVDFLLQEFIPFENEIGVFYYRIPGENSGTISGIVGKEFLTVTGDGKSSIGSLLKSEKRYILQLNKLRTTYKDIMYTILPAGVNLNLVPYGNHRLGTKFIDLNHRITDELNYCINNICNKIPGFYFGRLDIKFKSWEDLLNGKNYSIIELNGAGSEPTHIYDPRHSIFFAWKEIRRHWDLLFKISRLNAAREGISMMSFRTGLRMLWIHLRYLKKLS